MPDKPNTLYYENPDHVSGSRVTRDMMGRLCSALREAFDKKGTRDFIEKTRIPNERELYGLFVKALFSERFDNRVEHVGTEVQVARSIEDASGKGRVDIIFDYRNTSFLVELKVVRSSVNGRGMKGEDATPTGRLVHPWWTAVEQLRKLEVNSLGQALKRKVIKLPMAMYLHFEKRHENSLSEGASYSDAVARNHRNIMTQLQAHALHDERQAYQFSYFQPLEHPVSTSSRSGCLVDGVPDVMLYGFSIIAGMPETTGG